MKGNKPFVFAIYYTLLTGILRSSLDTSNVFCRETSYVFHYELKQ
jgi:hypothetical protein